MRRIQNLMEQWLFIGPDNRQEQVNLPHTWNAKDGQDGGNDYYRGTCHYEKTFEKPEFDPETEEVYLEFLGVNASSDVTVNGKELAHHDGGYSTFRVNITEALQEQNKLEVTVDNSVNGKIYPQKADFTFYGGIYRDVRFLIVSKEHFDLDYLGSNGIKITPQVKENEANVHIETFTNIFRLLNHVDRSIIEKYIQGYSIKSIADESEYSKAFVSERIYVFQNELKKEISKKQSKVKN